MSAQPYTLFVAAYEKWGDTQEVYRLAEEYHNAFEKDRNVGLIRRCLAVYRQRKIQKLAQVYSALSLGAIAQKIGLEGDDAVPSVYADVQEVVRDMASPLTFLALRLVSSV